MSEVRDCERLSFEDLRRVAFHLYGHLDMHEASKVSLVRIPINDSATERVEAGEADDEADLYGWPLVVVLALIVAATIVLSR